MDSIQLRMQKKQVELVVKAIDSALTTPGVPAEDDQLRQINTWLRYRLAKADLRPAQAAQA